MKRNILYKFYIKKKSTTLCGFLPFSSLPCPHPPVEGSHRVPHTSLKPTVFAHVSHPWPFSFSVEIDFGVPAQPDRWALQNLFTTSLWKEVQQIPQRAASEC